MLIVPGRPSQRALSFWIDLHGGPRALGPGPREVGRPPGAARRASVEPPAISLSGPGAREAEILVRPAASGGPARSVFGVFVRSLRPDSPYELQAAGGEGGGASARSRTLPEEIRDGARFTVAFGSCFSVAQDRGIRAAAPPPHRRGTAARRVGRFDDPVRLRFLLGDQIYMDLSPQSGAPLHVRAPDPFARYREQWAHPGFAAFLSGAPTVTLADDHEFWNDYPHGSAWLLWSERRPGGERGRSFERAWLAYQALLNLDAECVFQNPRARLLDLAGCHARSFTLEVPPLSIFVLDTRTERTRFDASNAQFAAPGALQAFERWAAGLQGPGILVLAQPLVAEPVPALRRRLGLFGDVGLPDYAADYRRLWRALLSAPHDVAVLAGDIHLSRLVTVTPPGSARPRLFELVSSPLARILGGAPAAGPAAGRVEWRDGCAFWRRLWHSTAPSMYATLSLHRAARGLLGEAAWWRPARGAWERTARFVLRLE